MANDPSPCDHPVNLEEAMPELSESDFELGDSDIHSLDSEWSIIDDLALKILKKNSKDQPMSSDEDDELIPLEFLQQERANIDKRNEA